jgi:C4-dicarboxylate transporter DctQ subunit
MVSGKKGVLDIITDAIEKVEKFVLVVLFTEVIIVGFMQVLFRFVLKASLPWSEELLRFSFIWLTYFASSLGIMKGTHASVDVLIDRFPRMAYNITKLVIELLTLLFCGTIFGFGLQVISMQIARSQLSPAMSLPMWVPYGGLLIAFGFMVIQSISRVANAIARFRKPKEA